MMGNRLSALLFGLVFGLGALAMWQLRIVHDGDAPMESPVATLPRTTALLQTGGEAKARVVAPLEELSQTLARPLFSSTRRPAPPAVIEEAPEPVAAKSVSLAPLALELSAVILDSERRFALFRQTTQGSMLRGAVGENVDGWLVSEIRSDGVSLTRGSERQELVLRTFKAPLVKAAKVPVRNAAERTPAPSGSQVPTAGQAPNASQAGPAATRRPRRALRGPRRRSIQRQQQSPAQR